MRALAISMAVTLITVGGCSTKRIGECHPGYQNPEEYNVDYQQDAVSYTHLTLPTKA